MSDSERGDWSYIASAVLALVMLATLALAADTQAIAYGRSRLWAAVTAAGRAAARCLAPGPLAPAQGPEACAQTEAQDVFDRNILGDRLTVGSVNAVTLLSPPSVSVTASAALPLPFTLPGSGASVRLTTRVQVALTTAATTTLP